MKLSQLIERARRTHQTEGLRLTFEKSLRFIPRYCRHELGTRGLYGNPHYQNLLYWWNSRPYSAVADPFKIIRVSPGEIIRVTGRGPNPGRFKWQDLGKVQGGDWDQSDERFEDLPVVQALRERFEDGKDWEDIEFIQHVLEQAERGHVIWRGCASEEDVWKACARVDRLYESIQKNGFCSKRELIEKGEIDPDKYSTGDRFNCYDEIAVDIGRDGEFLFVDGRHRLAIAKIRDIEAIPVRIAARHKRWQHIREVFSRVENIDEIPEMFKPHVEHPDLKELAAKEI